MGRRGATEALVVGPTLAEPVGPLATLLGSFVTGVPEPAGAGAGKGSPVPCPTDEALSRWASPTHPPTDMASAREKSAAFTSIVVIVSPSAATGQSSLPVMRSAVAAQLAFLWPGRSVLIQS